MMSVVNRNINKRRDYGTIRANRKSGAVKSLVLEYEQVLSPEKCDNNIDVKVMGGEISTTRPTGYSNNLVKQRINEFTKREIESNSIKKPLKINITKETNSSYLRSKSVDHIRKGKDEYSRSRQAAPRVQTQPVKNVNNKKELDTPQKSKEKTNLTRKISDKIKDRNSSKTGILNKYLVASPNIGTKSIKEKNAVSKHNLKRENSNNKCSPKVKKKEKETKIKFEKSYSTDEFEEVEIQLKDVAKTINELTCHEPSYVSEILHVFTNNMELNEIETNATRKLESLESIENIDVCLYHDTSNRLEDFGEVCKEELMNADFIEAYNQTGYELLITSVSSVKHSDEVFVSEPATLEILDDSESVDSEQIVITDNKKDDNEVESQKYFTNEELENLLPDEDYQVTLSSDNDSQNVRLSQDLEDNDMDVNVNKQEDSEVEFNNEYQTAIKSETIYDTFRNPRIAKVTSITRRDQIPKDSISEEDQIEKSQSVKPKIIYIIEEIIKTEKTYIDHLQCILGDYLPYLKNQVFGSQKGSKVKNMFANIRGICNETQRFYKALLRCGTYEDISKTFIRYKRMFEMYPMYCKNKPSVDQHLLGEFKDIVSVREKELNDQLGLASHLLTPIQRLGKYKLFLEQIQKEMLRDGQYCDYTVEAIDMIRQQMATGDLYIAVDSIKKSPIKLEQQGWLLMKEKFSILKPKKYEAVMFLFEKIVVFTTEDTKNPDTFIYKDSIYLNQMGISTFDYEPLVFILKRFPAKEQNEYTVEAKRTKDKKTWTEKIEKLLWEQLIACREKQRERNYSSKELDENPSNRKKSSSSLPGTLKPKSKFYLNEPLSGVEVIFFKK